VREPRVIEILSDGGGLATLAVDDLHDRGIGLATLSPETRVRLRDLLGGDAAVANPVDLACAADRDPVVFARTLAILAADAAVGAVLVAGLFGGYAIRFAASLLDGERVAAEAMARTAAEAGVGLVVHTLYAQTRSEPLRTLQLAGVPVVGSLDIACRCIAALRERGALLDRSAVRRWPPVVDVPRADGDEAAFGRAAAENRRVLLEPEGRALVAAYGVPLVPSDLCATVAEAIAAAERIGAPVAIRVVTPAAPHKTDAGGVALNVDPADAGAEFDRVAAQVRTWAAARGVAADLRGALVAPMLPRPLAELLVGVVRDPQFGAVLTVGAGGTAVEVLRDVGSRVLPVERADVDEMLAELRIAPLLEGARGRAPADRESIIDAVMGMVRCALAHEDISEIEANPVFAFADRAVAVDVRVYLR
jgi:acetyltransferase